MKTKTILLAVCAFSAICASQPQTYAVGKSVKLGPPQPIQIAVQWIGSPDDQIVYDSIVRDLTDLGLKYVPFKEYWNFCLYVHAASITDSAGSKAYAIAIQPFNRLKFFSSYQGIPFTDHDSFVHRFHIANELESVSIMDQDHLQSGLKSVLDRFNSDVFSTVKSYEGGTFYESAPVKH